MAGRSDTVEFRLFGHAGLALSGAPVKLAKRATTLSLLGYLVLHRAAAVARPQLAYLLFPDESEENALAELRRYLYLTQKALPALEGDAWIRGNGETVQWNAAAPCWIDVVEFERNVTQPEKRADAVALYSGDLLEEIYDDWVIDERERLRGLCLDALTRLVAEQRGAREYARALSYAKQLLRLDAWREDVVRAAMSVRYESGDSAGALAEFSQFAARLRDEMDVAPMPETLAVRDAILANDPLPGAVIEATARTQQSERPAQLPFVGRSVELGALKNLWSRAARGHGALALVHGEAGVGKTRLAAELASVVEQQGGRVFVGATSTPESVPYQPLVEALRSALQLLRARRFAPLQSVALARLLPEMQAPEEAGTASISAQNEAGAILSALIEAVLALSRPRPALLVLEDLHWAGRASLDAVAALARRVAGTPLLILGTYRDEEVGPSDALLALVRALQAERHVTSLALEPLARVDIAELVKSVPALAAARGVSAQSRGAVADRLAEYTEGNALFLSEAIAELVEQPAQGAPLLETPSAGISALIATRMSRLSEDARTVADAIAVAGQGCSVEVVSEVVALPVSELWAALNELLDRRVLREASARSGVDFAFAHHLIGVSIYDSLEPAERVRRHARFAHVLQRVYAGRAAPVARELATHCERAGFLAEAASWYGEAAVAAAGVYASDEVIALVTSALTLEKNASRRAELLRLREEAYGRTGDRASQGSDIDALEATLENPGVAERFDIQRRRALHARGLGESEQERAAIDAMVRLAAGSGDASLRAEAVRQHAALAVRTSRHVEALEPAAQALQLFETLGNTAGQVECLGLLVEAETNVGNLDAAKEHLEAMRERSATLADRGVHARALTVAATSALLRQDYQTAQDLSRAELAIATAIGDRDIEAAAVARIAATAAWLADFDLALTEFRRALDMFAALRNKRGLAITLTNSALLHMRLGMFDEAVDAIERSDALIDVVKDRRMAVANAVNVSFMRLRNGDPQGSFQRASAALDEARAIAIPVFEAASLANLGNAECALGRLEEGIAHMLEGIAIRRRLQEPPDFADDLADLTFALVAAGRRDEAHAVAAELATLLDGLGTASLWPHYVTWAAARGMEAGGETAAAAELARRAGDELRRFAASISDEAIRKRFLAVDISRQIVSAHAGGMAAR